MKLLSFPIVCLKISFETFFFSGDDFILRLVKVSEVDHNKWLSCRHCFIPEHQWAAPILALLSIQISKAVPLKIKEKSNQKVPF